MREIKFRVWTGQQMDYNIMAGFLGAFYVQGIDERDSASMSQFNTKYPESCPVMQYTGLHDKNGKEIYEGDIISEPIYQEPAEHCGEELYEIKYLKSGFVKVSIENNKRTWYLCEFFDPHDIFNNLDNIEVIGNKFENPDLC